MNEHIPVEMLSAKIIDCPVVPVWPDIHTEVPIKIIPDQVRPSRVVPFARVDCAGNEKRYVCEVIDSGWLTTASRAHELEERFAEYVGARHAIAVSSCTAALHLALEAAGVQAGDQVFVPTLTFTASAEIIRYLGAHPVLLDVEPDGGGLNPAILAEAILEHPDVHYLVAVHFGGQALEMRNSAGNGILQQCLEHGITVIEDAAHALPSRHGGIRVGALGTLTCFSFYANKTMTTGEGGMVTTNDDKMAARMRLMRLHGIDRDVWKRFTSNTAGWEYDVLAPGFKYNMADINAAVGLAQLERIDTMRNARQLCAEFYFGALAHLDAIQLPPRDIDPADHAWHLFPVVVADDATIGRDALVEQLKVCGIGTSVHYKPLHRLTYYRDTYALDPTRFPGAEQRWRGSLSLPIYNLLDPLELRYVADCLELCLEA